MSRSAQARALIRSAREFHHLAIKLERGPLATAYRNRAAEALRAARNVLSAQS